MGIILFALAVGVSDQGGVLTARYAMLIGIPMCLLGNYVFLLLLLFLVLLLLFFIYASTVLSLSLLLFLLLV
jgi:hypothetical protein